MKWRILVSSMIAGITTAIAVDIQAFRDFKDWHDAANYSWKKVSFCILQGAIIGALSSIGSWLAF